MPDLQPLLDEIDAIERCCDNEEWDEAAALLDAHQRHVHELALTTDDATAAAALLARQDALRQRMTEWRDEAATTLQQFASQRRGIASYGG